MAHPMHKWIFLYFICISMHKKISTSLYAVMHVNNIFGSLDHAHKWINLTCTRASSCYIVSILIDILVSFSLTELVILELSFMVLVWLSIMALLCSCLAWVYYPLNLALWVEQTKLHEWIITGPRRWSSVASAALDSIAIDVVQSLVC